MSMMKYFVVQPAHRTIGRTEALANIEQTVEPWECRWTYRGCFRRLVVPSGYIWDGASVPRAAWSIIGLTPWGLTDGPSLAHDPLYRSKGGRMEMDDSTLTDEAGTRVTVDRIEADWLFETLCIFSGIHKARAKLAHAVVRAFGNRFWGGKSPTLSGSTS